LSHLLTHATAAASPFVINEFGAIGVDGELLRSCGIPAARRAI